MIDAHRIGKLRGRNLFSLFDTLRSQKLCIGKNILNWKNFQVHNVTHEIGMQNVALEIIQLDLHYQ